MMSVVCAKPFGLHHASITGVNVSKSVIIWRRVQGLAVRVQCPHCRVIVPLGDVSQFLRGDNHWIVRPRFSWRCVWCFKRATAGDKLACAEVMDVC